MKRTFVPLFSLALLAVACSSGSAGPIGNAPASGSASISGNVGGKAFAFRSGIAHVAKDGGVDIVFTDADGLCDALVQQKFRAGQTLVQAYGLEGTAPGAFSSTDVKFASLKSSCASGTPIETAVDRSGRAKTTQITITSIDATEVKGSLDITFEDGSAVAGDFTLPVCSTSDGEKATCE